jgi:hypothetical protein
MPPPFHLDTSLGWHLVEKTEKNKYNDNVIKNRKEKKYG